MSKDGHRENAKSAQNQPEGDKSNAKQSKPQQDEEKNWFKDLQGSLMTVAVLVASATYTAGLSPPGGLWGDDQDGHTAGTPILRDKSPDRYTTFFYANSTAFMSSLVIIILLTNENVHKSNGKVVVLLISMVLDLVSMMIAFAAGSARSIHTSVYVIALAVVALLVIFCFALLLPYLCCCVPNDLKARIMGPVTATLVPQPVLTDVSEGLKDRVFGEVFEVVTGHAIVAPAVMSRDDGHSAVSHAAGPSHSVLSIGS